VALLATTRERLALVQQRNSNMAAQEFLQNRMQCLQVVLNKCKVCAVQLLLDWIVFAFAGAGVGAGAGLCCALAEVVIVANGGQPPTRNPIDNHGEHMLKQ
jgi:hypothetical protein